ncbi:MAG: T9SS type A sorting domain-containing protein [Saprospiraceae bacterium]|nr:T9SS type A sorting domain-containing protein [Saprospiraceae bacterium]
MENVALNIKGGKLIYRGAWKHEGNGYIQFDKDHILITHQTFGIRGIEKGIRFMRLNTGCNLKILQDVILGKGKVDYEPGSKIEVASAAASITYDSLVCQGTINHIPSFSTGSIALLSYGSFININFSDFYHLENGIKHVSLSGKFGTANGEKMDLKRTISSEVKYPLVAAGMRLVQLDSVYFTNGIYSEIKECLRTELLRVGISRMSTTGFKLNDAKYFIVRNSFFTNNAIGIEGITKSNIFCYQTSFIGQPIQAIKMTGTYDDGLVELGCCNFQNNGVCVGGVDILFSLNPQSVNPQLGTYGLPGNNKFIISAPQKYFHVQYLTRYVTEVDAKYNYWGGGTPAPSDYFLKYYSRDISLEYDPYYSILINCIPQTPPNNPQNCQLIGTNSGIGFNQITNQAMTEFHQGAIETTQQIMSEISDLQNMDYWTVSAHCRFIYDYARVFTNEPLPPHQEPIISSVSDQNNTKLHINPNPFINELGIEFEEKYKSLKITNIYGQLMFESTKSDNSLRLNINTGIWPDGIYLIKIVDSSDNAHKQLALKVIRN